METAGRLYQTTSLSSSKSKTCARAEMHLRYALGLKGVILASTSFKRRYCAKNSSGLKNGIGGGSDWRECTQRDCGNPLKSARLQLKKRNLMCIIHMSYSIRSVICCDNTLQLAGLKQWFIIHYCFINSLFSEELRKGHCLLPSESSRIF